MDTDIANAVSLIQNNTTQSSEAEAALSVAKQNENATPAQGEPQAEAKDGQGSEAQEGAKLETQAQTEAKDPKEKQNELISKRYATLSLKEREVQKAQAQLKREREEFERLKNEKGDAQAKTYDDPLELLEAHGFSYDDVTQHVLTGTKPEAKKAKELEKRLAQFEADAKAKEEAREKEAQEKERKTQETNYIAGLKSQVEANPERFEILQKFGEPGIQFLYQCIVAEYNERKDEYDARNETPNALEIADRVEAYYDKQIKSEIEKFKSTKKLGGLFQMAQAQKSESQTKPEVKAEAESVTGTKTLTNSQSQTATKTAQRQLTDEEMIAEAAKLISAS